MKFQKVSKLQGELTIPGDKSISHRSVMFGAIAKGTTEIHNFLQGADCLSTISCFRKMGISVENSGGLIKVHGNGMHGLKAPSSSLDCGNSGTTTRLISGILAAQDFTVILTGDSSIQKRPMKRIMEPLALMGGELVSVNHNDCVPLRICGKRLHGIHYHSKVASAQVKSSILLAGLYAEGNTSVTEPKLSRNHSEIMLEHFGASLKTEGTTVTIEPPSELYADKVHVPGDISSAAFFIAAGLMVQGSQLLIQDVGINPTRDGLLHVCRQMGADITLLNQRCYAGEPVADILVKQGTLTGVTIEGAIIPTLIDELPVIAAMACLAQGVTVIKDASELKVKESNRIEVMVKNLSAMGADITETDDGMIIRGGKPLHGAVIDSHFDHRIAMTFAVAGLCADGETEIKDAECVNISYPGFYTELLRLVR